MPNLVLSAKNLNVELGGEKVLEDLSFDLKEKEILIILGPNGAGKSVLLRTLLGLMPFNGEIQWKKDIHVGYVPEEFFVSSTLPLSVKEFFRFKKVSQKQILTALNYVGMETSEKFLKKKLGTLSSGQLRRILIAWVMADLPDVILLDEPMVGIDIHGRETIHDSLEKTWAEQGQSIILVSHEIGEIVKKADRVLAINKRKLFFGPPEKVITPHNLAKIYGSSIIL
ncbi:hypothetical protein AMJ50_00165 [Parcubacteria bacterium DG_74_3]|nr:MAG: hypothetical protein AMJ50_00165 [Parcubacteria bacterium DG_74_3]